MPRIHLILIAIYSVALLLPISATGQQNSSVTAIPISESAVNSLHTHARLDALERENQALSEKVDSLINQQNASKETLPNNIWRDVSNESWSHKVSGRVLTETFMWAKGDQIPGSKNYTEIRQIRLGLNGKGYGILDYSVQLDFEPEVVNTDGSGTISAFGSVAMKDAFVGMHDIPWLGYVRIGHFKVAFSHDQLLSRRDMTFMERTPMADPAGFTPGREVGIQAYNHSADQNFTWQYGAYYDNISETSKERVDDNQGFMANLRGSWTPYYDEPSDGRYIFHLGLAGLYVHPQDDSGRFRQRPEIHEGPFLIDTGAIASEDYTVMDSEVLVHWGPFYLNHELFWARVNSPQQDINLYSGYIETGWFLTGEHRTYNRNGGFFSVLTPFENFWLLPGSGGVGSGAWEVAARWSFVDFTEAPNNSTYNSANLALNWYWNENTRVQLNYIMPFTQGAPLGDTQSSILGLRLAAYF